MTENTTTTTTTTTEDPAEQLVTVAAVWLATEAGAVLRWLWRRDEPCAYCRYLDITGPCPGAEAHLATQVQRQVERTPAADVRGGLFEVPAHLDRGYLLSAVEKLATAAQVA